MRHVRLLLFALALAVPACSLLPRRQPAPALHDFGSASHAAEPSASAWSTVRVDAPEWLRDEGIRYRLRYSDPTRIRFYARDRWLAPPPALLAQRLSVSAGGRGYRLRIRLLDFEQVFDEPRSARTVLNFQATALAADGGEIVAARMFRLSRATPSPDAAGAVAAFSALVDEAVGLLEHWRAELPMVPAAGRH